MGILENNYQDKELESYFDGSMTKGLGIDCDLDNNLVFKRGQFNLVLGNDNVGKTFWVLWYLTMLSVKRGLTWTIYASENEVWSVKQKIMSFFSNDNIKNLEEKEYYQAKSWMDGHFNFVDTRKNYTIPQLLKVLEGTNSDGFLIDPYNSLSREKGFNSHEYDYEMANLVRLFCRSQNKTIYINMHPVTEASRNKHNSGDFKGQQAPPQKSHAEGGQKWPNRCDDFLILHRYFIEGMKTKTLLYVDKVKETETGGDRTNFEEPLVFEFENYGFSINGKNPLLNTFVKPVQTSYDTNGGFENIDSNFNEDEPF